MNVNGTFRFHNVGQGLFYSGLLSKKDGNNHSVFNFVYDCGTESKFDFLKREIDDYKLLLPTSKNNKSKKIDFLIISHLHDDHVNGLEYLLKEVNVDTVIMPYMNDALKLLARLESDSDNEFLQTFYIDPVAWFISKGVHRIFLIGAEVLYKKNENYLEQRVYIENLDSYVENQDILGIENINETQIVYVKKQLKIYSNQYCWEFKFENLKLELEKLDLYIQIVEDFQKNKCMTLEQIFKSKLLSNELMKEIKKVLNCGLNRTSVVLLHRPIKKDAFTFCTLYGYSYWNCFYEDDEYNFNSTVLTGDIELKEGESLEILNTCKRYFVIQYPHHGSGRNNIDYFRNLRGRIIVLSYGIINKYGHPHSKVLQRLHHICCVNERCSFDYQIFINEIV